MDFVRFTEDGQILDYLQYAMPRLGMGKPKDLGDALDKVGRFETENIVHHSTNSKYRDHNQAIAFAIKAKWTLKGYLSERYAICFFSLDGTRYLFREVTGEDFPEEFHVFFAEQK